MWTGTAIFPAGQWTAELQPCLGGFGAVMVHLPSGLTDGDAIFTNRKVILVLDLDAPLLIEVDEWDDALLAAVEIVGHGIMCGIQEPFFVLEIRQESLHPEISLQETMGIMF